MNPLGKNFSLKKMSDLSDEAILDEIRRVAQLVDASPLTAAAFDKVARVSKTTVRRRFGSWDAALKAAGLEDRVRSTTALTDAEVLEALRKLASEMHPKEITVRDINGKLPFDYARLKSSWGSAPAAFAAAGIAVNRNRWRSTEDELKRNLLAVWAHYGRQPTYAEMNLPPSSRAGKAYSRRYGSWVAALENFVMWANEGAPTAPQPEAAASPMKAEMIKRSPRDVPLGLRFRVLRRDNFRCVLCGDNPPQNPGCVLHIDHVRPWSQGGETIEENLRTLCASCNLGRSDRYSD